MGMLINYYTSYKLCIWIKYNDQQNRVISCGGDKLILIIEQSSQELKWNFIQKISVEVFVIDYVLSLMMYSHFNLIQMIK
ncbi:unnamed protein product [Paramecium pentaurelia]|uniref:Transmembrane protein n=1 Tax=Paramecium pentaurelia TaxID=43138 RepID=A0A8S1TX37_9CILI|nr:unnamed protein product [Paramecium pentaurelia]